MEGFGFAVSFVRGHPLFDKLLRTEPDMPLPLLTVDRAPVLALYRMLIAERLQAEIDVGRAAPANVDQAAEVIARLAMSLILTREGAITLDDRSTIQALVRDTCSRCSGCQTAPAGPSSRPGGVGWQVLILAGRAGAGCWRGRAAVW